MSTLAQRIAKLQQERRDLEKQAYMLSAEIGDQHLMLHIRHEKEVALVRTEQRLAAITAEVVQLQQQPKQAHLF
jgi:hypothetical protein